MKITLAGTPGSGKSTLRSLLAEHYNLEVRGTGDFMRKISKQHGYNDITKFLIEYVSKHPEVDNQIDEEQRLFGEQNEDFVLDAHLGFHFVPDSIRICLTCNCEESAYRILADKERTTEAAKTISDSMETGKKRWETMRKNFLSLYKIDIDDHSNFDLVLDTSSLSSAEVFGRVSKFIDDQTSNI